MNINKKQGYKKAYFLFFVLIAVLGFSFMSVNRSNSSTDRDHDGYASIPTGGTDCVDQEEAKFIEKSGTACDSTKMPKIINFPLDIVDHTWIKDVQGTWHIFFSMGTPTVIQHYTSIDLVTFTNVGPALSTTAGNFDSFGLWAPYVMESNGIYYLFYTGVTGPGSSPTHDERIGLATSSDLTNWTRVTDPGQCAGGLAGDGCVLSCGAAWTTWGNNGDYTEACRDPFVIRDEANNRWVMFLTTKHISGLEVVSAAYSTDLVSWTMAGHVKATKRDLNGILGQLTGYAAENPFVMKHNDTYYLWFNDWHDPEDSVDSLVVNKRTQQQYVVATDLLVDDAGSANWIYGGYTPLPGVNATEVVKLTDDVWVMSQSISNGNVGTAYYNNGGNNLRNLIWHRVVWNADGTFGRSRLTNLVCRVSSASINPNVPEVCGDGIDNNCNGNIDETSVCAKKKLIPQQYTPADTGGPY